MCLCQLIFLIFLPVPLFSLKTFALLESNLKKAAPKSLKKRPKSSVDSRRRSEQNDVLNGNVNQSEDDEANGNTKIIDRKSPRHYSPEVGRMYLHIFLLLVIYIIFLCLSLLLDTNIHFIQNSC